MSRRQFRDAQPKPMPDPPKGLEVGSLTAWVTVLVLVGAWVFIMLVLLPMIQGD